VTSSAPLQFLILLVASWLRRHQGEAIEYLRAENRVLRARLGPKRLRFKDAERRLLSERGKPLGRRLLAEMASLATPETILRWYRERVAAKYDGSRTRGDPGRPRSPSDRLEVDDEEHQVPGEPSEGEHLVGEAWLMTSLSPSPLLVSLLQSAVKIASRRRSTTSASAPAGSARRKMARLPPRPCGPSYPAPVRVVFRHIRWLAHDPHGAQDAPAQFDELRCLVRSAHQHSHGEIGAGYGQPFACQHLGVLARDSAGLRCLPKETFREGHDAVTIASNFR
jgi:hypothetical protein